MANYKISQYLDEKYPYFSVEITSGINHSLYVTENRESQEECISYWLELDLVKNQFDAMNFLDWEIYPELLKINENWVAFVEAVSKEQVHEFIISKLKEKFSSKYQSKNIDNWDWLDFWEEWVSSNWDSTFNLWNLSKEWKELFEVIKSTIIEIQSMPIENDYLYKKIDIVIWKDKYWNDVLAKEIRINREEINYYQWDWAKWAQYEWSNEETLCDKDDRLIGLPNWTFYMNFKIYWEFIDTSIEENPDFLEANFISSRVNRIRNKINNWKIIIEMWRNEIIFNWNSSTSFDKEFFNEWELKLNENWINKISYLLTEESIDNSSKRFIQLKDWYTWVEKKWFFHKFKNFFK